MAQKNNQTLSTCPVCGVSITDDGKVNFTVGKPGTRAKLYARVCKFNQKPGCINQEPELIGDIAPADSFPQLKDISFPGIQDKPN